MSSGVVSTTPSYLQVAVVGFGRGLVPALIKQPLDTLKMQAQITRDQPLRKIAMRVLLQEGVLGFYRGAVVNTFFLGVRQAVRFPLLVALPPLFRRSFASSSQKNEISKVMPLTGACLALVESLILSPMSRFYLFQQIAQDRTSLRDFFWQYRSSLFSELYRRSDAIFMKHLVSWTSFLMSYAWLKDRLALSDRRLDIVPSLMTIGICAGIVTACTTTPFEVARVALFTGDDSRQKSIVATLVRIYQSNGVRGLFRGWSINMYKYSIHGIVTFPIIIHWIS